MNTTIQLPNGYTLTNLIDNKGRISHAIFAKLHVPGMKRAINTTFNVLTGNLILHEWYLIPDEQRETIAAMLTEFFSDYTAALAMK